MKALRSLGERDMVEEHFLWYAAMISFGLAVVTITYTHFGIMGIGALLMMTFIVGSAFMLIVYATITAFDDDFDHREFFDTMMDVICKGFCGLAITIFAIYQLTQHASNDELMVLGLMVGLYLLGSLKSWGVMWFYHRVNRLFKVND